MKIKTKLIVMLVVFGLGIILTEMMLSYEVFFSYALDHADDDLLNNLDQTIEEYNTFVHKAGSDLTLAASNPIFKEYYSLESTRAENHYSADVLQFSEEQRLLKEELDEWLLIFQDRFQIDEMCSIDHHGQEHSRVVFEEIAPDVDLSPHEAGAPFFEPGFQQGKNDVHISDIYMSADSHRWVFAFVTPIILDDGTKASILHFEMFLKHLQDLITDRVHLDADYAHEHYVFVIDSKGLVMADSRRSINLELDEHLAHEGESETVYREDFFPSALEDESSQAFKDLIYSMQNGRSGMVEFTENGETYFAVYKSFPFHDWSIAEVITKERLVGGIFEKLTTKTFFVLLGIIFLIFILGILLNGLISVPLEKLTQAISSMKGKKIDPNLHPELKKINNEIGTLALAFSELLEDLKEKTEEQEKTQGKLEQNVKKLRKSEKEAYHLVQELNDSLEKLKEIDIMKSQFLSITSHELKTPLTPIRGQLQLIMDQMLGKINGKQRESLDVIKRNIVHLQSLIDDILDVSKLESRKMKFVFEKQSLKTIVKESVEDQEEFAKQNKIKLKSSIRNLPTMVVDGHRIRQVITNLVNNAIKFSKENGTVTVKASKQDDRILLSVKDSGVGIEQEDSGRLFRPFSQIDSSYKRQYEGTGLGLVICKGIVGKHGGRIWFESEGKGKGTTFFVELPIWKKPPLGQEPKEEDTVVE